MKKLIMKNGKEVKMGDVLVKISKAEDSFQGCTVKEFVPLDEKLLEELVANGVIRVVEEEPSKRYIPTNLDYYVEKLAAKKGWKFDKMAGFLEAVDSINPVAAYSMVLREVALELDKQYKNNIRESEHIFVIALASGKIVEVDKKEIKHWNTFSAFRSAEDAKIALGITKDLLEDILNGK